MRPLFDESYGIIAITCGQLINVEKRGLTHIDLNFKLS